MLGTSSVLILKKFKTLQKHFWTGYTWFLCPSTVQFLTFNTSKNLQSNTGSKNMQSSSEVTCFYYTSITGISAINSMNYRKMLISSAIKHKQSFHYKFQLPCPTFQKSCQCHRTLHNSWIFLIHIKTNYNIVQRDTDRKIVE